MKKGKKIFIILLIILFLAIIAFLGVFFYKKEEKRKLDIANTIKDIKKHYNNYVIVEKEANIYTLDNTEYKILGKVGTNVELEIEKLEINENTKYFKITNLDDTYYIYYKDVTPINELKIKDDRYKHYIPFNENIVTNDKTTLYNKNGELEYEINKSYEFPIIIKDTDKYYVEYNNELLYVLKDSVKETKSVDNHQGELASQISTVLYHFIYNPEREACDQVICHTVSQVQAQFDYLKANEYFTLKLPEFEMWIDGKLNLPKKSIVLTVDDGLFGDTMRSIFIDNKLNANVFLVTSWFDKKYFEDEEGYVTCYSHTHEMHVNWVCPLKDAYSQGGALLCYSDEQILNDLKTSSELLDGTKYLSYPFYDYNERAINLLKQAGYTMGFGGVWEGGHYNMTIGGDKFRIPRITFLSDTTTVGELQRILATN